MRKIIGGVIFLVACVVVLLALQVDAAFAQNNNHYKTYIISSYTPPPLPVPSLQLTDQFGTVVGDVMTEPSFFSNPVYKMAPGYEQGDIFNPDHHLTWYQFNAVAGPYEILVSNQFGNDQPLTVENTNFLLLPAHKMYVNSQPTPHSPPSGLDHYLCYDVTSAPQFSAPGVTLIDQFNIFDVVDVGQARIFCNPVQKEHLTEPYDLYEIIDADNHLTCYDITVNNPAGFDVEADDQFGGSTFIVDYNAFLCLPSTKEWCGGPEICDGLDNNCDGVIPPDEFDDDGDGYVECTPWSGTIAGIIGGDDCDDSPANGALSNPGLTEDIASGNCSDTFDNDCDTLFDSDPECSGGACSASVESSTIGASKVYAGSAPIRNVAHLLMPVGALIAIRLWRRRK